jgi:hypothetical protein
LRVLDLLSPNTDLTAVAVEGVPNESSKASSNEPRWDGVDCTLFYGGTSLENASRVELLQLKYSGSDPQSKWTVARLTKNTARKKNNSILRKMAKDFANAKARMAPDAALAIKLISNQEVSSALKAALAATWFGPIATAHLDQTVIESLKKLQEASGLADKDFAAFIDVLDFDNCGSSSRFSLQEGLTNAVANLVGDSAFSEVNDLIQRTRTLMGPERPNEIATIETALSWFGVGSREALFPCPPEITLPARVIERETASTVVQTLQADNRFVLVHGSGGCGKTTLMQQVARALPAGSVTIVFDCFGGGQFNYPEDKRHLPERAFLQLINQLAADLGLPLFLPQSSKNPADIRTFLDKLRSASKALSQTSPQAVLLIVIDAADNAATAATSADPMERPFIFDLFTANTSTLPGNVRFLVSSRSSRCESLQLPHNTKSIACPEFSLEETKHHIETLIPSPPDNLVQQFHALTDKNPRVQAYALAAAREDPTSILDTLLPNGKTLPDVLERYFQGALVKLGQPRLFDELVGALAIMPPPVSVIALADVVGSTDATVRDFALDLSPGIRLRQDALTVADEDFEDFIRTRGAKLETEMRHRIAESFLKSYKSDSYPANHVADALIAVDRTTTLLDILKEDPDVSAIVDPVLKRQVQLRRLALSLRACRNIGSKANALQTVLISAEAERDDTVLNDVLGREIDLSVEFGNDSVKRSVLLDREQRRKHGSILSHDALRSARAGDTQTAWEQLRFYGAWLDHRNTLSNEQKRKWEISIDDIAARAESLFLLVGADEALREVLRWRPRYVPLRVAQVLVPRLIAAGKADLLWSLAKKHELPKPWDLTLLVPLAMAKVPIETKALARSLQKLDRRLLPDANNLRSYDQEESWETSLLNTFVSACELGFYLGVRKKTLLRAVRLLLAAIAGRAKRKFYLSDSERIDAFFRCWFLRSTLRREDPTKERFLKHKRAMEPNPSSNSQRISSKGKIGRHNSTTLNQDQENDEEKLKQLYPLYAARMDILSLARSGEEANDSVLSSLLKTPSFRYDFDHDYDSGQLRRSLSCSIMRLLILPKLSAKALLSLASSIAEGPNGDLYAKRRLLLWRFMHLRTSEFDTLVNLISTCAREVCEMRTPSSEKVDVLLELARLLLPVSRPDSASLFANAIAIAKEIDREAFDQIKVLAALAENAEGLDWESRYELSDDIFAFVSGAAELLEGYDYFPWDSGVHAITCIDASKALAAIARWLDEGVVSLETSFSAFLTTALQRGELSPEVATSLTLLVDGADSFLQGELLAAARAEDPPNPLVVEELSKDALLLTQHSSRASQCEPIACLPRASDLSEGFWETKLRDTVAFVRNSRAEEAATPRSAEKPAPDFASPEKAEYELETNSGPFITVDSISAILRDAKASALRFETQALVEKMRDLSAKPRDRVDFLNALASVPDEDVFGRDRLELICKSAEFWKDSPAVSQWCRETLPKIIVSQFDWAVRYIEDQQSLLQDLYNLAELSGEKRLDITIAGISEVGEHLYSRALFGVAQEIAAHLKPSDSLSVLRWYAQRSRTRLPQNVIPPMIAVPNKICLNEAIARFLYALMSDIDTRIRWKAAHALRRLSRFGYSDLLARTISQHTRKSDNLFRSPEAPYYFLAAKLWLLISLYRISEESPSTLADCKKTLIDIATSAELPHLAIREYAKRALLELDQAEAICLTRSERSLIETVNLPAKRSRSKWHGSRSRSRRRRERVRFKFDEMDTVRYWYDTPIRLFPSISEDQFLEMADKWVTDVWGAGSEARWWDKEPRKRRYNERKYHLWSHSHGSRPTIERYGTYLEWHAMHCVVGELLVSKPLAKSEDYYDSFEDWTSKALPTEPPFWLSDNRGPKPLEKRLWFEDKRTHTGWLHNMRKVESLDELGLRGNIRPGWIVLRAYHQTNFPRRETRVYVNSALVAPSTGPALVRALKSIDDPTNYFIQTEGHDTEVDRPPYRLVGWLRDSGAYPRFDDLDPFRYEVGEVAINPGARLSEFLELRRTMPDSETTWVRSSDGMPALVYQAWSDEPDPEDRYQERHTRSSGHWLLGRVELIQLFLQNMGLDLIFKVKTERFLHKEYGQPYETAEKRKTHDKVLLFRQDGSIFDARGRTGSWTRTRSRAKN